MNLTKTFITAAFLLALVGCDGDTTPPVADAQTHQDTAIGPSSDTTVDSTEAALDTAAPDTTPATPSGCSSDDDCKGNKACVTNAGDPDAWTGKCVLYPKGPYGTEVGDVIANLRFWQPFEKRYVYLHEFYNRPEVSIVLVAHGAGWCGPCQYEAEQMVKYFKDHGPMFQVLYALFQDTEGKTLFTTPQEEQANMEFMTAWRDTFEVNYTLVADQTIYPKGLFGEGCMGLQCDNEGGNCAKVPVDGPCDVMHDYYTEGGIPFSILIDNKTMKILFSDHGYSGAVVTTNILKYIYNPPGQ
jgi:hypothetical protein